MANTVTRKCEKCGEDTQQDKRNLLGSTTKYKCLKCGNVTMPLS